MKMDLHRLLKNKNFWNLSSLFHPFPSVDKNSDFVSDPVLKTADKNSSFIP
jgi:hypothetical protein